jgi:hypothetical protein
VNDNICCKRRITCTCCRTYIDTLCSIRTCTSNVLLYARSDDTREVLQNTDIDLTTIYGHQCTWGNTKQILTEVSSQTMEESFTKESGVQPTTSNGSPILDHADHAHTLYIDVISRTPSSSTNGQSSTSSSSNLCEETNRISSGSYVPFYDQHNIIETMDLKNFTGSIRLIQATMQNQEAAPLQQGDGKLHKYPEYRFRFIPDTSTQSVQTTTLLEYRDYSSSSIKSKSLDESDELDEEQQANSSKFKESRSTNPPSKSIILSSQQDKVRMPQSVRQIRNERRNKIMQSVDIPFLPGGLPADKGVTSDVTKIHWFCAQSSLSEEQIESCTLLCEDSIGKACQMLDKYNSLPIHLIGNNEELIYNSPRTVQKLSRKLLKANPTSIICLDTQHRMPFISLIEDWYYYHVSTKAKYCTSKVKNTRAHRFLECVSKSKNIVSNHELREYKTKSFSIFQSNHDQELNNSFSIEENTISDIGIKVNPIRKKTKRVDKMYVKFPSTETISKDKSHINTNGISNAMVKSNIGTSQTYLELANTMSQDDLCCSFWSSEEEKIAMTNVASVTLWFEIDFCFQSLSYALSVCKQKGNDDDDLKRSDDNDGEHNDTINVEEADPVSALVRHILNVIPNILYIILLIDNENDRNRILQYPITQQILLCPASVGSWFPMLLRRQAKCSCAVDYLFALSNLSSPLETGNDRNDTGCANDKYNDFCRAQRSVFLTLKRTPKTMALLSLLDSKELDRALKTKAVSDGSTGFVMSFLAASLTCVTSLLI